MRLHYSMRCVYDAMFYITVFCSPWLRASHPPWARGKHHWMFLLLWWPLPCHHFMWPYLQNLGPYTSLWGCCDPAGWFSCIRTVTSWRTELVFAYLRSHVIYTTLISESVAMRCIQCSMNAWRAPQFERDNWIGRADGCKIDSGKEQRQRCNAWKVGRSHSLHTWVSGINTALGFENKLTKRSLYSGFLRG